MKKKIITVLGVGVLMLAVVMLSGVAYAQTASTTPGTPTTGAGGDLALNITLLASSLFLIIGGIAYLYHPKESDMV